MTWNRFPPSGGATAYGVDGCKAGWFYFSLGERGYAFAVAATLGTIVGASGARDRIFVDMPIGLLEGGDPDRGCDGEARALLGPRASSVFPAPARAVLDCASYPEANALARTLTGRGLSRQTFGIVPRIRELDRLMRECAAARRRVRESHPEVCFWALAGGRAMAHPKKTQAGFEERLAVLASVWPEAEAAAARAYLRTPRAAVARDDVLDALVLAVAAHQPAHRLATLPSRPRRDACGLPMEMVFARAGPDVAPPLAR